MNEVTKIQVRERNLKMKLAKIFIEGNLELNSAFTLKEISSVFYFRESDINNLLINFFSKDKDKYVVNKETGLQIEFIRQKREESIGQFKQSKELFVERFRSFRNEYKSNVDNFAFVEEYRKLYSDLELHLEILHWYVLPEYSEQIMINRRLLPESNLKEYYDHYHTLEDLYEVLIGDLLPIKSFKGDINLNHKLTFKVFSRRWGHDDQYNVERRIDGWYVSHISINGLSKKDGTGALIMNLEHDSIKFPEDGVKYALETLWDMADETEMSVDELQNKLQEIADWISAVEKVTGEYQPEWCMYY